MMVSCGAVRRYPSKAGGDGLRSRPEAGELHPGGPEAVHPSAVSTCVLRQNWGFAQALQFPFRNIGPAIVAR